MDTTPVKSGRRVLGDLTVNTTTPSKLSQAPQGVKQASTSTRNVREAAASPAKGLTGKKRGIDEVNGASGVEGHRGTIAPAKTREREPADAMGDEMQAVTREPSEARPVDAVDPSEQHTSQVASQSPEASRAAVSPTGDATPRPLSTLNTPLFSNDPLSSQTVPSTPTTPITASAKSYAETLRLRLRLALYKVQTNQIHVRLSDLKISSPRASLAVTSRETVTERLRFSPSPSLDEAGPSLPSPKQLLPSPAFCTTSPQSTRPVDRETSIPSSPPTASSSSLSEEHGADPVRAIEGGQGEDDAMVVDAPTFTTPRLPRHRLLPDAAPSPTRPAARDMPNEDHPDITLTSSVVKGRAASGLLELGRGGGGHLRPVA